MYGCAGLLHWVHVLESVRMRGHSDPPFLFEIHLDVYFEWEYESFFFHFFLWEGKWPLFDISGSLLYPSFHPFMMWLISMIWSKLSITHFSISLLSFNLYSITPFHSTSSNFFLFSSCLMFDLGSTSTHYTCLFDMFIPLSSFFIWEPLGWVTHEVFLRIASHAWGVWGLYHWDYWA